MKVRSILIALVFVLSPIIFVRGVVLAQAGPSETSNYAQQCQVAQGNLNSSVKNHDLRSRVYRVQAYQYIHQRLDIFTQRLENNNQAHAADLRTQTDQLQTDITTLTVDYEAYDSARDAVALLKDCRNNQLQFTKKLADMRTKRQKLNDDVVRIDSLLGTSIHADISDLYNQLLITGTSGVNNE